MIRIGLIAALAVVSAASAFAQMQRVDPAVPSGLPESKVEPSGSLGAPVPPQLVQNLRRHDRDADARQCLELPTNRQVHRCSLKYRSHAARAAAVTKVSSKPSATAKVVEPAMPQVEMRTAPTGAPRPGDAAKAAELVKPMDVTKSGGTPTPMQTAPAKAAPPAPAAPATKAAEPAKK